MVLGTVDQSQPAGVVTTAKGAIPQRRLERFAREERLLFLQRTQGATIPFEPTRGHDIVLDFSRALFDHASGDAGNPRALHLVLEALDRLAKERYPFLGFHIIGVSDTVVRYGLKQSHSKSSPGMTYERVRMYQNQRGNTGLELQFSGVCSVMATAWPARAVGGSELDLSFFRIFSSVAARIYKACQETYYKNGPLVNLPGIENNTAMDLPCTVFKATPNAARALYLRMIMYHVLSQIARFDQQRTFDAELMSRPGEPSAYAAWSSPPMKMMVPAALGANIGWHCVKKGDYIIGGFRLDPDTENILVFNENTIENAGKIFTKAIASAHESENKARSVTPPDGSRSSSTDGTRSPSPQSNSSQGQTLSEEGPVDEEFRAAAQRAVAQTRSPPAMLVPPIVPESQWNMVARDAKFLDAKELRKLQQKVLGFTQMSGVAQAV